MNIKESISQLVGNTPLLELKNIQKELGLNAHVLAKLEYFNPAGSAKDRVALNMIENAEREGKLQKGSVIIEPTSGNTGIGLAAIGVSKGYEVILTMPETMSVERIKLIQAYGAKVVLTEGFKGMQGAVDKAKELKNTISGSFIAGQFTNPDNPQAHYKTTGPEIFRDTEGKVDAFVATVGTGGTLSGTGKYLKENINDVFIAAVEPASSPLLSKGHAGPHKIQGIGANFIPDVLDRNIYDEILCCSDEEAMQMGRLLAKKEGILVGISSGAAVWAAVTLAKREEFSGKNIVAVLPDTGERYLSSEMYKDE